MGFSYSSVARVPYVARQYQQCTGVRRVPKLALRLAEMGRVTDKTIRSAVAVLTGVEAVGVSPVPIEDEEAFTSAELSKSSEAPSRIVERMADEVS